jgi:hypothetical protein
MSIAKQEDECALGEELRGGFNLMSLPLETLHRVLSFLPIGDVVNFAFVCQQAFDVSKELAWEELDFSTGHFWLEDVKNLSNRSQATCQTLTVPASSGCPCTCICK